MSIRVRLTLFGLFVVALTLAIFTLAFYGLLAAGSSNGQDQQLSDRADQAVSELALAGREEFVPRRSPAPLNPAESTDVFVILLAADGTPLFSTGAVDGSAPRIPSTILAVADADGEAIATIEAPPGERIRVHVRPWSRPDLELSGHVVIAQSSRRVENDLRGGRIFLFVAATFAFFVAAIAIWLVIGRALRPLRQLEGLTREVGLHQDLGRRLPVPRANDEVRRLSESFNSMMSHLEESHVRLSEALESQKRFVADASHELRTPLTTIRSNAGFLLQHPDAQEGDRFAAIRDIASESERVSRLIQDLLILARADGGFHLQTTMLDMSSLVQDVARQASTLYTDRQVVADVAQIRIDGNEDSVKQLLWILIDNSARHTTAGGHIRVALERRDGFVDLLVADDGEGIPDDDLHRIFDRFYQADASRSDGGSGLGLAIASWIAAEHGWRISARGNDGGGATVLVAMRGGCNVVEPDGTTAAGDSAGDEVGIVVADETTADPSLPPSGASRLSLGPQRFLTEDSSSLATLEDEVGESAGQPRRIRPVEVAMQQSVLEAAEDEGRLEVVHVLLLLQGAMGLLSGAAMLLFMGGNPMAIPLALGVPMLMFILAAGIVRRWQWARKAVIIIQSIVLFGLSVSVLLGLLPQVDVSLNIMTLITNVCIPIVMIRSLRNPRRTVSSPPLADSLDRAPVTA